jgi:hypothetical protein
MGGYDIFQSRLNWKDSSFSKPVNLGYPINTTDDDIYYVLSANGDRGYYASGKAGGHGLKDIYTVYPGYVGKKPSIYMVKGKITENGTPIGCTVIVEIIDQNNKKMGEFVSNSSTGKYLISLPSGGNFKLSYKYKNYPYKTLDINTLSLDGYDEQIFDVNFDMNALAAEPKKDSVIAAVKPVEPIKEPIKEPVVEVKEVKPVKEVVKEEPINKNVVLKPNSSLQEKIKYYSELYGDISAEGLEFRVQIAAYKFPKNYVYSHLKGLGDVENLLLDDGITRITIGGNFNTLGKAFEHNIKVINAGQKDAFVTVLYKGKRIYLEDLEKMGIFVKK